MAIAQSRRTERREDKSGVARPGNSRDGLDTVANAWRRDTESRPWLHVGHAGFANRTQDREATFTFARPGGSQPGLQLSLAYRGKRIHHVGRRIRGDPGADDKE